MGIADALLPNPARVSTRPAKYKLFFLKNIPAEGARKKELAGTDSSAACRKLSLPLRDASRACSKRLLGQRGRV